MSKKILFFCLIFIISVFTLIIFSPTVSADDYSHIINLEPGWNLVSAARLVESHEFSLPEILDNFDIYLLDPTSQNGWATMADLGQSEFTPLYGYFINNKSTSTQTLTLNYIESPDPSDRLFSRELTTGWNVVGIANPGYALSQYAPSSTDTNNPSDILISLSACVDIVVDMTANASSVASVLISDQWEAKTFSQINELNDFRETKAYAVFVDEACNYQGFQNDNPIVGKGSEVITFSKVTTSDATYTENASQVLLYKGKITANDIDDLKVEKVTFDASFGSLGNIDESFDKLYFKKVNYDASETEIDSVTSLSSESVSFSGFTLDIPKGSSNGIYVVVRGDVKSSPTTGTLALRWDNSGATTTNFNVKNSDNNPFIPKQYIIDYNNGHTTTIATTTKGTYNVEFDLELAGINNAKNVLAGTMPLIGRLKFTADNENAIIEDLVIQNLGDATNGTLTALYLYDNAEMSGSPLSSADMAAGVIPKALFENVNIVIPTSGDTYIYIAGSLKAIDYSASPGAGSTGEAEATIALRVPATALNYVTKVVGANTGEILNNPFLPIDKTATSTVYGAVMSNITTDFANATLLNGTAKDIFSFKVTAPSSSNIDPDGDALGIKMTTATFRIATTSNIDLTSFKIERVGGANGEKDAKNGDGVASVVTYGSNNTVEINFFNTYSSTDIDLTIRPGDIAKYIIMATITNVGAGGEAVQITIESVDSNVAYVHETGNLGTPGADTATIRPLFVGISNVRGGTLSN